MAEAPALQLCECGHINGAHSSPTGFCTTRTQCTPKTSGKWKSCGCNAFKPVSCVRCGGILAPDYAKTSTVCDACWDKPGATFTRDEWPGAPRCVTCGRYRSFVAHSGVDAVNGVKSHDFAPLPPEGEHAPPRCPECGGELAVLENGPGSPECVWCDRWPGRSPAGDAPPPLTPERFKCIHDNGRWHDEPCVFGCNDITTESDAPASPTDRNDSDWVALMLRYDEKVATLTAETAALVAENHDSHVKASYLEVYVERLTAENARLCKAMARAATDCENNVGRTCEVVARELRASLSEPQS